MEDTKDTITVVLTWYYVIAIVSITKFSIVIGSPRAYLSRNRCAISWVSNLQVSNLNFGRPRDSHVNYALQYFLQFSELIKSATDLLAQKKFSKDIFNSEIVDLVSYNSGSNRVRNFKSTSRFVLVRFRNYTRNYSLNCTLLLQIEGRFEDKRLMKTTSTSLREKKTTYSFISIRFINTLSTHVSDIVNTFPDV